MKNGTQVTFKKVHSKTIHAIVHVSNSFPQPFPCQQTLKTNGVQPRPLGHREATAAAVAPPPSQLGFRAAPSPLPPREDQPHAVSSLVLLKGMFMFNIFLYMLNG